MTPKTKAARSTVTWLALGAALLLAPAARAQSAAPDLAAAMAELSAAAARAIPAQKAYAAWIQTAALAPAPSGKALPDSSFTPGHLCTAGDPNFKEFRYAERIPYCNRNVTQQMKVTVSQHYGVPQANWANYEFDHLIPLAIGGDSSIDNLWPQPRDSADSMAKDKLENDLYLKMNAGTITQADAVRQIYGWFTQLMLARTSGIAVR